MRSWIELYDAHMTDIAGCTVRAACDALRNAAQVFCQRTKAWRVTLDPMVARAGQQLYEFDISNEIEIIRILSAKVGGVDFPLQAEAGAGDRCIRVLNPIEFSLYPAQSAGTRIELYAAIEPSNTASGMDDWFADRHAQVLAKGAKSELLAQADKPYSNPERALMLRAEFELAMAEAKGEAAAAYSAAPLRTVPQFF